MASWNTIKEAVRALKGQMSKNERNAAKYQKKKERGPVKAFFHITKNENVPAIEQQGLLTNHPNANINSANHPFRKHGTDAGGVWVTTEPTAFPVYGTTIGGKNGNASARADALSTIKIEVPLPELAKMKAVQDPYGKNILRKGNDPRAVENFGTWAGIDVPTTVLLNDIKPGWLKNIGYVEEADMFSTPSLPTLKDAPASWVLRPSDVARQLNKADFKAYVGYTGHNHGRGSFDKSPSRLVLDQISRNQPISKRLPVFPVPNDEATMMRKQGAQLKYDSDDNVIISAPNDLKRYSTDFIPAETWTTDYADYTKPGESIKDKRYFKFAPGAISRGMGGVDLPSVKARNFNWNKYKQLIAAGNPPGDAMYDAAPRVVLDWDNIIYTDGQYRPTIRAITGYHDGAISRGNNKLANKTAARVARVGRRVSAEMIRDKRSKASEYLSRSLGRQPTAEEIEHWARAGIWNDIESGDLPNAPAVLNRWADKTNWDIVDRISRELEDHAFDP